MAQAKTTDDLWNTLKTMGDREDVILTAGDVRALILHQRKTDAELDRLRRAIVRLAP